MPTRIYLPSSGAAAVTPTDWEFPNQINPVGPFKAVTTRISSTMTSKTEATGTTSPTFRAMGRHVIGPLAAQTISGTVKGQMRGSENNAGANATLALSIKIIQPNGNDRAVLLGANPTPSASDSATAGHELATSLTNAQFEDVNETDSQSLTSQSATAGDYLVIEWGFRSATTTSRNITLSYGDDSGTDLGENTTDTSAFNPWIEFSGTIAFLFTGTAAVSVGPATATGSATFTAPVYSGTAAVSIAPATVSGSATFEQFFTATAAINAAPTTASGSATFTAGAGTFTATAAVSAAAATASGSAEFDPPVYTASAAVSVKGTTASGSATFSPPVFTAGAAVLIKGATASGSATFVPPVYTAAAAVQIKGASASGAATHAPPSFTATGALQIAAATASGSATVTNPAYAGSAAVSAAPATAAGSALFAMGIFQASAVLAVAPASLMASATFTSSEGSPKFPATGRLRRLGHRGELLRGGSTGTLRRLALTGTFARKDD